MQYRKFLRKTTYLRYLIFILTVFFSYYSIRAVSNNRTIDASIAEVQQANEELEQEILFKQNFYKNYLESKYASYFLWHENGQLFDDEQIIRIRRPDRVDEAIEENEQTQDDLLATPQQSRQYFINVSLSELTTFFGWSDSQN